MKTMLPALIAVAALSACSPRAQETKEASPTPDAAAAPSPANLPAGDYHLDPAHASLIFKVSHIGFSHYTASFSTFDAALDLDPAAPENASLTATVDVSSLTLPTPPAGFHDTLMGPAWFDADAHPEMTFKSTSIEMTGDKKARIEGVLSMRGETQPVTLEAVFNGGYAGMKDFDPQARVGFSALGTLQRSAFGMDEGLPPPGTQFGVSDAVEIVINAEFLGPPLADQ